MILAEAMREKMGRTPIKRVSPRTAPAREQDPASPHLAFLIVDVLEAKAEDHRGRSYLSANRGSGSAGAQLFLPDPYGKMIELNQVDQCPAAPLTPAPLD